MHIRHMPKLPNRVIDRTVDVRWDHADVERNLELAGLFAEGVTDLISVQLHLDILGLHNLRSDITDLGADKEFGISEEFNLFLNEFGEAFFGDGKRDFLVVVNQSGLGRVPRAREHAERLVDTDSAARFLQRDEHFLKCFDHRIKESLEIEFFLEWDISPGRKDNLGVLSLFDTHECAADGCGTNIKNDDKMLSAFCATPEKTHP